MQVDQYTEVGYEIFDFFSLVEGLTPINAVFDITTTKGFFKRTTLGIGPIEDSKIVVTKVVAQFVFQNSIGYKLAFIVIGKGAGQFNFIALAFIGPQRFFNLVLVVGNHFIGCLQNGAGASVILFQLDGSNIFVIFLELKNVLHAGATERINALGIVAHYTNVFVHGA